MQEFDSVFLELCLLCLLSDILIRINAMVQMNLCGYTCRLEFYRNVLSLEYSTLHKTHPESIFSELARPEPNE